MALFDPFGVNRFLYEPRTGWRQNVLQSSVVPNQQEEAADHRGESTSIYRDSVVGHSN